MQKTEYVSFTKKSDCIFRLAGQNLESNRVVQAPVLQYSYMLIILASSGHKNAIFSSDCAFASTGTFFFKLLLLEYIWVV